MLVVGSSSIRSFLLLALSHLTLDTYLLVRQLLVSLVYIHVLVHEDLCGYAHALAAHWTLKVSAHPRALGTAVGGSTAE